MKKASTIIMLLVCLILYSNTSFGQCNLAAGCRPIPSMFVETQISQPLKQNFQKGSLFKRSKRKLIKKADGYQDQSYLFSLPAFQSLIKEFEKEPGYDTLEVYFARYDAKTRPSGFPVLDHDKKLILLLYPHGANDQNYYFLDLSANFHKITVGLANTWITDYVENVNNKYLVRTIRKRDSENHMPSSGQLSDTRKIHYGKDNIYDAFICEPEYQKKYFPQNEIREIQVSLSVFPKRAKSGNSYYGGRLFIQFDYIKFDSNNNAELYNLDQDPDEMSDYLKRKACTNRSTSIDNGQLCPTVCQ